MKQYFPALDGLRFIAFLLVFIHHVTFYVKNDINQNPILYFFRYNGWVGVEIFFVLTGFLITIHLLNERAENHKFNLKNFLLKRVVRIWPLYYLAILVGYFIVPFIFKSLLNLPYPEYSQQLKDNLVWYLLFLGNFKILLSGFGDLRAISQLWAISLDQQFYIFWPLVLLYIRNLKKGLIIAFGLILFSLGVRFYLDGINISHPGIYVNTFARLDSFMWGVILAFILFFKQKLLEKLKFIYTTLGQIGLVLLLNIFLYLTSIDNPYFIRHGVWGYLVLDFLVALLILSCIKSQSIFIKLLNIKVLSSLGRISYGLYIWHILALEIIAYLILPKFNLDPLLFVLGLPLTILFGTFSYNFFEKRFLNFKPKG